MRTLLSLMVSLQILAACATQPAGPALTRIAFGSCLDQKLPQPIWGAIRSYKPEMFLFLGDNVYGDVSSGEMAELKRAYAALAQNPGFKALQATSDVHATWDDHDYGRNDAGANFRWRARSQKLFLDFWKVPAGDPRHARDGIYSATIRGPPDRRVQVILLDTRSFRSRLKRSGQKRPKYVADPDPAKTILGPAQWAWLEAELRKPADLRLLVSSIQVLAEGHGFERWGNLPLERERLFGLVRRTGANGVILLSGDRHFGTLYRNDDAVPYPLYEVTSSSLNRPWRGVREQGPYQRWKPLGMANFGTIDLDWTRRRVAFALRDPEGTRARHIDVPIPGNAR